MIRFWMSFKVILLEQGQRFDVKHELSAVTSRSDIPCWALLYQCGTSRYMGSAGGGGGSESSSWMVVQNRQRVFFCSGVPYILVLGGKCNSPDLFVWAPSDVHWDWMVANRKVHKESHFLISSVLLECGMGWYKMLNPSISMESLA